MDRSRLLSGDHLVAKGITKVEVKLPEIGLKDILPNGSWLEQKQIQAALEARKHLIEVERIEKCGTLSHAEWRDDLMLAEVTRKAGSYWQYMGHNMGKHLFLQPEEALFLMEINSLLLKHNEIIVSLQKAYSLLLGKTISIDQYKVYASLSRLGYRVFRHKYVEGNKENSSNIQVNKDMRNAEIGENLINEQSYTNTEDNQNASNAQTDNTDNLSIAEAENVQDDMNKDSDATSSVIIEEDNVSTSNNDLNSMDSFNENASQSVESEIKTVSIVEVDDNINEKQSPEGKEGDNKNTNNLEYDNIVDSGTHSNEYVDDGRTGNENSDVSLAMEVDIVNDEGTSNINESIKKDVSNLESAECGKKHFIVNCRKRKLRNNSNCIPNYYQNKIQKLRNRKFKPCNMNNIDKYFVNIPNFCNKHLVTVKAPQENHIPKNIFVNKTSYVLNLEKIQRKFRSPASTESTTYSVSDEVNDFHIRRLRSSSIELPQHPPFMNARFLRHQQQFRPYSFWRPRLNLGYYQFNLFFQRPYLHSTYFPQRAHFQAFQHSINDPRFFVNHNYNNINAGNLTNESSNAGKRNQDHVKAFHLQAVKNLAMRLKELSQSGTVQSHNVSSLHRLLQIYNARYYERFVLTHNYDIVNNKPVIETIELDDDEESNSKKPRLVDHTDEFNKHLSKFKALAAKLKGLEAQDRSSARHRRAFSNALKTFNKSYNADIYLNVNFEIIDRKYITLESSSNSDSDCVIDETNKTKGKKLRNPFNTLKRLSGKRNPQMNNPSTSKGSIENDLVTVMEDEYSERLQKTFDKKWLPDYNDLGRADLVPRHLMNIRLLDSSKEEYLYDFMKSQKHDSKNWMDIKIPFLRHVQVTYEAFQSEYPIDQDDDVSEIATGLKSIIGPEDCTDMKSILEKLRIVQTNYDVASDISLTVDFDVYNRDVQNFRKKNRPKAHFRVICKNESSSFPSAEDITSLQSSYNDNVAIVYAVIGVGSISYLQINTSDLPVNITSNDLS